MEEKHSAITVAVESAIHDALRGAIQKIFDQHGILVGRVDLSWLEISAHGASRRHIIDGIRIDSQKTY